MAGLSAISRNENRVYIFFYFLVTLHIFFSFFLFWADTEGSQFHIASISILGLIGCLIGLTDIGFVYWLKNRIDSEIDGVSEENSENNNVYNIQIFSRRMQEEIARASRHSEHFSLASIAFDVKRNSAGFAEESRLNFQTIQAVVHMLMSYVREEDCLATVRGSEFVLLMPNTDSRAANLFANRLSRLFDENPIRCNDAKKPIDVKLIIATVTYPIDSRDPSELLSLGRVCRDRTTDDLLPQVLQ